MNTSSLTISELAELLNVTLEEGVGTVVFTGEIHQLTRAQSGHIYFDLKDEESKISAVMWQGVARTLSFLPDRGMEVVCQGRPNVYHRSGKLQMIVMKMEPAGEGALQKKFLELKAKLEKEGLFREDRKRPLPYLPRSVGIITSASGAAIHDIVVKLNERMPCLKKYLIDARVQGPGAAEEIAAAIEQFNQSNLVEVIVVGRGGGSLEDLWAFNEEVVVRAIFASRIPIVSGVGHEVDVSLSDLVADVRAPTPTAAAECVVPGRDEVMNRLFELFRRLADTDRWLQPLHQALDEADANLRHSVHKILQQSLLQLEVAHSRVKSIEPASRLALLSQKLLSAQQRLEQASGAHLVKAQESLERLTQQLKIDSELKNVAAREEKLFLLSEKLQQGVRLQVLNSSRILAARADLLDSLSHQRVLDRGYALVQAKNRIVRSKTAVKEKECISVMVADGSFAAVVSSISNRSEEK